MLKGKEEKSREIKDQNMPSVRMTRSEQHKQKHLNKDFGLDLEKRRKLRSLFPGFLISREDINTN